MWRATHVRVARGLRAPAAGKEVDAAPVRQESPLMRSAELLLEGFNNIRGVVHAAVEGLTPDQLAFRVDDEANTIGWLVWHLTRVQDGYVAEMGGTEPVWTSLGFADRFGLPFEASVSGYGQSPEEVGAVRVTADDLIAYFGAVHERTVRFVKPLTDADLDRVVDRSWDPPVTLGVRLVSVTTDDLQHAGQAAFVRGLVQRRSSV
jgi:hypothetical protein